MLHKRSVIYMLFNILGIYIFERGLLWVVKNQGFGGLI